jgi:hypothetical protein
VAEAIHAVAQNAKIEIGRPVNTDRDGFTGLSKHNAMPLTQQS